MKSESSSISSWHVKERSAERKERNLEVTAMIRFKREASRFVTYLLGFVCVFLGDAIAQSATNAPVQHLNFNRPEAWALKYFTSATLMSGLQPPETLVEERRTGSVTVGLEMGWLPALSPERARVGLSGKKQEDLNKTPIFIRLSVRVGVQWRLSLVFAGTPPFRYFC